MSETVNVCNEALGHLGMGEITDITENTPSAIECNRYFTRSVEEMMRRHKWVFSLVEEELAQIPSETVLGFEYLYTYPASAAIIWDVFNEATADRKHEQQFEVRWSTTQNARVIASNLAEAYADKAYIQTNPAYWDPLFRNAFAYYLAAKMAHALLGDPNIGVGYLQSAQLEISEARRIGSIEKIRKPNQSSGYINARA